MHFLKVVLSSMFSLQPPRAIQPATAILQPTTMAFPRAHERQQRPPVQYSYRFPNKKPKSSFLKFLLNCLLLKGGTCFWTCSSRATVQSCHGLPERSTEDARASYGKSSLWGRCSWDASPATAGPSVCRSEAQIGRDTNKTATPLATGSAFFFSELRCEGKAKFPRKLVNGKYFPVARLIRIHFMSIKGVSLRHSCSLEKVMDLDKYALQSTIAL